MKRKMNKKGNMFLIGALALVAVVLAAFGFYMYGQAKTMASMPAATPYNPTSASPPASTPGYFITNPSSGTTVTLNARNVYNFTSDALSIQTECYSDNNGQPGSWAKEFNTGTALTGQNFGQKLICKGLSNATNQGKFYGVEGDQASLAAQGTFVDADGWVHFTVGGTDRTQLNSHIVNLLAGRYGGVQAKAYDVKNSNFMYDAGSATNNVFKTTGKNWTGVTNNNTCTASAGNYYQYRLDLQSVLSGGGSNFAGTNEVGTIAGFQIPTATFGPSTSLMSTYDNVPLAHFDSANVNPSLGMTDFESAAYTADNFKFYLPPVGIIPNLNPNNVQAQFQALPNRLDQAGIHQLMFYIPVKGGVTVASNNADDIILNLHPRSQYLSIDGRTAKIGAIKDDGANTATQTVQSYRFCTTT